MLHLLTASPCQTHRPHTKPSELVLPLCVRRQRLLQDSFRRISKWCKNGPRLLKRRLRVTFDGESGIDSGGLTKEWYLEVTSRMFHPDLCLFKPLENGHFLLDSRSVSGVRGDLRTTLALYLFKSFYLYLAWLSSLSSFFLVSLCYF
jgi:hypothetical protein